MTIPMSPSSIHGLDGLTRETSEGVLTLLRSWPGFCGSYSSLSSTSLLSVMKNQGRDICFKVPVPPLVVVVYHGRASQVSIRTESKRTDCSWSITSVSVLQIRGWFRSFEIECRRRFGTIRRKCFDHIYSSALVSKRVEQVRDTYCRLLQSRLRNGGSFFLKPLASQSVKSSNWGSRWKPRRYEPQYI